jgi:uncharacterized protein YdhG (YjbR/CyaY superfamily)
MITVNEYIAAFDKDVQERLKTLQQLFLTLLPKTQEGIHYNIPSYTVGKGRLYFAAYKNHIGFYPVSGLQSIQEEIEPFIAKKAPHSLHFMHNKSLPIALIKKIIKLKAKEN